MLYSAEGIYGDVAYFNNKEDRDRYNNNDRLLKYENILLTDIAKCHIRRIKNDRDMYICPIQLVQIEEFIYENKIGDEMVWLKINNHSTTCNFINYKVRYQVVKNLGLFSDLNKLLFSYIDNAVFK